MTCSPLKFRGDGPIEGLTVTADSKGDVKGYVFNPSVMLPPNAKGKLDVGGRSWSRGFKRNPGYWAERALCRTDYPGNRRDCRGFNVLFCYF